jgi:hypothetical protein
MLKIWLNGNYCLSYDVLNFDPQLISIYAFVGLMQPDMLQYGG